MKKLLYTTFGVLAVVGLVWAADIKITQLPEDTSPTSDDLVMLVDNPGIAPVSKKSSLVNLTKAFGWIDSRAYATLELANTAAYNAGKLLVISQNYTLTANTTLTAAIEVIKGGGFTKASTYTLAINGPFEAGFYQVFSGFASGVTFGTGKIKEFYPQWWGAKGDGTTDDTTSLRAAYAAVAASIQYWASTNLGMAHGTALALYLPKGVYRITGDINNGQDMNYITVVGDDPIIQMDPGVTAFTKIRYDVKFKGIQFFDGATALSVSTGNIDTCMIDVENCIFFGQTDKMIKIDATSYSTLMTIRTSKFVTPVTGTSYVLYGESGDFVVFEDCWVLAGGDAGHAIFRHSGLTLVFRNVVLVPVGNFTAWVDNYGSFLATHSHFGAERPMPTILRNYASSQTTPPVVPSSITIRDSRVYVVGPIIKFYAIPNAVEITGNRGFIETTAFYIDPAVPAADLAAIGGEHSSFILERNNPDIKPGIDYLQGSAMAHKGLPFVHQSAKSATSTPFIDSDVLVHCAGYSISYGGSWYGTATQSSPNDELGVPSTRILATANGQYGVKSYTTALGGLSAQLMTAVFAFEVDTDDVLQIHFFAGNGFYIDIFGRGRHVVSLPFYYPASGVQSLIFSLYGMPNASQVTFTRWAIIRGHRHIQTKSMVLSQAAAPTAGTWYFGDRVINSPPVIGQPKGWVLPTSGVWTSEGNL